MPFCGVHPWRLQFFTQVSCPSNIYIPISDPSAWTLNPNHNWVYDKLKVAQSQGLLAAPHGVIPKAFPVFSKPITNLGSLGNGSMLIPDMDFYKANMKPGHFWSELLTGAHLSTDGIVVDGEIQWLCHTTCVPGPCGTFKYFHVHSSKKSLPKLDEYLHSWTSIHLPDYTGTINFETIGNQIIEIHLRFADQWVEFYGDSWLKSVVALYEDGVWNLGEQHSREGYSIPLFGSHGKSYNEVPGEEDISMVKSIFGVTSVQITFDPLRKSTEQSNPPGGFRLATINSASLESGLAGAEILRERMGWY